MKPEDELCPFEHAKRLKNLGITQKSLHYYIDNNALAKTKSGSTTPGDGPLIAREDSLKEIAYGCEYYAAYSADELGMLLPGVVNGIVLIIENDDEIKYVSYPHIKTTFGPTEAQAGANMLIWLIENNYLTVQEMNEKLLK